MKMNWANAEGETVLKTLWWGDDENGRHGYGWRTCASPAYLIAMLRKQKMSMIVGVELRANEESVKYKKQWRMYVLDGDGTIVRVDRRRRHLGPALLRKAGMTNTTDTLGRWLLHRIGDLDEQRKALPEEVRSTVDAEIASLCDRFGRQRAGQRW